MTKQKYWKQKYFFKEILFQFCVSLTLIILIWSIVIPYLDYEKVSPIVQAIIVVITGMGAIGLYLPIGMKISEIYKQIRKEEEMKNDKQK